MAGPAHIECTHCGKAFPTMPTYERHLSEAHLKVGGAPQAAREVGDRPSQLPRIVFGLGFSGGAVVVVLFFAWLILPDALVVGAFVAAVVGVLVGTMAYGAWGEM